MFLTSLVFISAIILEALGSYISVVGISFKTGIFLTILAITLDFCKVIMASVLYKNWKSLNIGFKLFLVPSTLFLMCITSFGAYSYLLQEFSKTSKGQEQSQIVIASMEEQKIKLQKRKEEIDAQITAIKPEFVTQKRRTTEMFKTELDDINTRLMNIDKDLPAKKIALLEDNTTGGTLVSLANAWGKTPLETSKILALMITLVIDPLAIVMLMVASFLQAKHTEKKESLVPQVAEVEIKQEDVKKEKKINLDEKIKVEEKPINNKAKDLSSHWEKTKPKINDLGPLQKLISEKEQARQKSISQKEAEDPFQITTKQEDIAMATLSRESKPRSIEKTGVNTESLLEEQLF